MTSPLITFKNEHLSVSRLRLFEQCDLAFFLRYIEKGATAPRGDAADFGVVLHAALEAIYKWIVVEEYRGMFPEAELLVFYRQAWQESAMTSVAAYQEGLQILRTYSRSRGEVDHMNILSTEQEFNIDVHGYKMNGYIDRIDKKADDHIVISDYKSNRLLYTRDDLATDLQMSIYGLAARVLHPWAKRVTFEFHMLRHDLIQAAERTADTIDNAGGYVAALGLRTETRPASREAWLDSLDEPPEPGETFPEAAWPAKLNPNCGYCDHRMRCAKYRSALAGNEMIIQTADLSDMSMVVKEREHVAKLAKMMYARKEELDKLIKAKLARETEFAAGGYRYKFINNSSKSYPIDPILRAFADAGISIEDARKRLIRIDPSEVEAWRAELDEAKDFPRAKYMLLRANIEALEVKTPATPRLDSRAEKTEKKAEDVASADKSRDKKKNR